MQRAVVTVTVTVAAAGLAALPAAGGTVVAAAVAVVLIVTGAVCWAVADAGRAGRLAALIRAARGLPPDGGNGMAATGATPPAPLAAASGRQAPGVDIST
jgi:hypothetical protein